MEPIKNFFLKLLEKYFPNYLKLGDDCLSKKQYNKAIEYYRKAEKIQSKNPYLFYHWATCLFSLGEHEKSLPLFEKAIKLNPEYAEAYCSYGITLFAMKNYDDAIRRFRKAAKLNSEDPKVFLNWGLALEMTGDVEKANSMYNRVLELTPITDKSKVDPYRIMALNQFALLKLRDKKLDEAAKAFEEIVTINNKFAPGFYNLAIVYTMMQKPEEAIKNLKASITIDYNMSRNAKVETAFQSLASNPDFITLVGK